MMEFNVNHDHTGRTGKSPNILGRLMDRKSLHYLQERLLRRTRSLWMAGQPHPGARKGHLSAFTFVLLVLALMTLQAPQALAVTTLTFTPVADTYVDARYPTKAHGAKTNLAVDASSAANTFLRFQISGLRDMSVVGVRLRMYSTEGSVSGGRVWTMSEQNWSEATTSWSNQPSIDGKRVGAFGAVSAGAWYETTLSISTLQDGPLSLALDSTSIDRAHWGSREVRVAPRLLLDIVPVPANAPPLAVNDAYEAPHGKPLNIAAPGVLGNDTDAENDPLTALQVTGPVNGTLVLNDDGGFIYTPNPDFTGSDSFTYKVNDGNAESNVATAIVNVAPNSAPIAENDSYGVSENTPLIVAAPGLLRNDSDVDGDEMSVVQVSPPQRGKLILNANGGFTYTPNTAYIGNDSFTYKATDGKLESNTATVTIRVAKMGSDTFEFVPQADAYVHSSRPTETFGTSSGLWIDNDPERQAFLKFAVDGLAGRTILGARLRLYQLNSAPTGGAISLMGDTAWDESVTWDTRPSVSGPVLANFDEVAPDIWYEVDLGPSAVAGDGVISLAVDTLDSDGAKWASREHHRIPRLLVDVAYQPGLEINGVSRIANDYVGSSDPTHYASQHRLAMTSGGRQLAVHGRHKQGVQLAWRDSSSGWQTTTRGDVQDGLVLSGTGTGDWAASIVVAEDALGEEHAWIVYAADEAFDETSVHMRRLNDLDHPAGPVVGPEMTVSAGGLGISNVDLAFAVDLDGRNRGCLAWVERTSTTSWDVKTAWFSDLASDKPAIEDDKTLISGLADGSLSPTLSPSRDGMGLVVANRAGRLQLFRHDLFDSWQSGPSATSSSGLYPSAVTLDNDDVFAAAYSGTEVRVFRLSEKTGRADTELSLSGYRQPALASDGNRVWLFMVRSSDGYLVSRERKADGSWGTTVVESRADGSDLKFRWPNTLRTVNDGFIRLVAEGPNLGAHRSAVLAYQRKL